MGGVDRSNKNELGTQWLVKVERGFWYRMYLVQGLFSRLAIIIKHTFSHLIMIEISSKTTGKHLKIQNKSEGISTKNYVAFDKVLKKWLKTKCSTKQNRDQFQSYLYSTLLALNTISSGNSSLLCLKQLTIQVDLHPTETEQIVYYIQRPFVDQSVKEIFESPSKYEKSRLDSHLPQLLHIYLKHALTSLPVICPSNLLSKKKWNHKTQLYLDSTSLVGYHFLVQKSPILISKFKQIYCYLHPKVLSLKLSQKQTDFQCQLFSFSMNLLSIIIGKEISHPLYVARNKYTFSIGEAETAINNNVQQMKKLIKSNLIRIELQRASEYLKYPKLHFLKFFQKVFDLDNCPFQTWSDIFHYFDPQFFSYYQKQTSEKVFESIRQLYENEPEQTKIYYEVMGLIKLKKSSQMQNKKELLSYMFLKYNALNDVKYSHSKSSFYHPQLYILYKRIQLEAQSNRIENKHPREADSDIDLNFKEEMEESLSFNIYSFPLVPEGGEVEGNETTTIYVANDFQETLNIYRANLWL